MIVDLRNAGNLVYFNGTLPDYIGYRLRLVSRYSNKEIRNGGGTIDLTLYQEETDWFSMKLGTIPTSFNEEINDYYDCYLEGECETAPYQTIQKVLCKVINTFDSDNPNVKYLSDNENNEQYIYFIDE